MKKYLPLFVGALVLASPAAADHIFNLGPYSSRGDCESAGAAYATHDRAVLLERFPQFFSTNGEVASFLARAFPCDYNDADGQWYMLDHRDEVLDSDWFKRRL